MIYCDTSLLIPTLVPERFSGAAEDWLAAHNLRELAFSDWTDTEMASALAQKRRSGLITSDLRRVAADVWGKSSAIVKRVGVDTGDFAASVSLVDAGPRGLRSGDALHLAIAIRAGLALATLDRDLADAAEASGVEVALRPPA